MIPRISTVALWRSLRRVLSVVLLLGLITFGTGAAIVVQAGRSDSPPADAALVMLTGDRSTTTRLDRARQLYREGKISRILLAGIAVEDSRAALVERGVQEEAVIVLDAPTQLAQLVTARQTLAEQQLNSALLIAEPVETLRLLKIARDSDLRLLTLPTSVDTEISFAGVLGEIGRYFRYVLLNR